MNSRHFEQALPRAFDLIRRARFVVILLALMSVGALAPRAAQASPDEHPNLLMQFTAGGHVLGFQRDAVYIASASHALRIEFVGGAGVAPVADAPASSTGRALPLSKVSYPNVWDGISVSYEATAGGIAKSSYLLDAGAGVEQIRLRYNLPIELDASGDLVARAATGEMRERAPIAWQEIDGQRIPIQVAFRLFDFPISNLQSPAVGFALGEYNRAYPLVIDPDLTWSTFLGGSGDDSGNAIAVDGSGNVYVAGTSTATWGASPVQAYTSGEDAFAAKLNSSGALQWNTFLGGSGTDRGHAIAVDASGNVYVAGNSDATWGSPVRAYTSGQDAFAAKLNSSGALQWNTFLGGSGDNQGTAIAVDGSGNVYVAGYSTATWGASPVRAYTSGEDAFAAKLNSSGALQWNTFLGGPGDDWGDAIAVDGSGNVYVAGNSGAAFAAKLNSSGVLQWNTFLGTSYRNDRGQAIAVDGSGNVYVAGDSRATWGASPVRAFSGKKNAFAAKLNSSGALQWNTFLGGGSDDSGFDTGTAIALDGSGNVYVAGNSPYTWGSPVQAHTSDSDAFAAKLNSSGALQWNTFLNPRNGSYDDRTSIAVDGSRNVYVAGTSTATWGSPVRAYTSGKDAFVAKLSDLNPTNTPTNTPSNTLTNTPSTTLTNTPSTTPTNTPPDFLTGNAWIFALCCGLIALGGLGVAGIIFFVWRRRGSSSTKRAPAN